MTSADTRREELVEVVARAMCKAAGANPDAEVHKRVGFDLVPSGVLFWTHYIPEATAALDALLAAGYAKRSDVVEECAKVADAYADQYLNLGDAECDASYESGKRIAHDIRNLKDKP